MTSREVLARLASDGWHVVMKHPTKPGRVTVVHPVRDFDAGTLRSMEKQSGVCLR